MATRSALHYENRINILKARDPVGNSKLIKKLQRSLRNLESNNANECN